LLLALSETERAEAALALHSVSGSTGRADGRSVMPAAAMHRERAQ
jgi:hypothetical protein